MARRRKGRKDEVIALWILAFAGMTVNKIGADNPRFPTLCAFAPLRLRVEFLASAA